jgi:chromosome segregation ATPase
MGGIAFLDNINMMVLASIVIAVLLAFVLVVVVFAVKLKSQQEKSRSFKEERDERHEKITLLEESLSDVRILNASLEQELSQQEGIKSALQAEIDALTAKLQISDAKIETLNTQIVTLEKNKSELGASVQYTKESLAKLEDALEQATKRNEFWVEQMTEIRTKYEALKLKLK